METVYPRKREAYKGFLDAVVGDTKRQVENKRVEDVVSSGSVEVDLRRAFEVCHSHFSKAFNTNDFDSGARQDQCPCQYIIA